MLVLTRKRGQRILIGDDIIIEIKNIVSDFRVQIGVTAPRHVKVIREELSKKEGGSDESK